MMLAAPPSVLYTVLITTNPSYLYSEESTILHGEGLVAEI